MSGSQPGEHKLFIGAALAFAQQGQSWAGKGEEGGTAKPSQAMKPPEPQSFMKGSTSGAALLTGLVYVA